MVPLVFGVERCSFNACARDRSFRKGGRHSDCLGSSRGELLPDMPETTAVEEGSGDDAGGGIPLAARPDEGTGWSPG